MTEVPQDEVELSLLKTGLGSVTQSDVEAAALAEASIFAFNVGAVPPDVQVRHACRFRFGAFELWAVACASAVLVLVLVLVRVLVQCATFG